MSDGRIFISYRTLEKGFALNLRANLENSGAQTWIDCVEGIIGGDDWRLVIQANIDNCAALIAVISPDYLSSSYCRNELARASDLQRPIIPILLKSVDLHDWPLEIQRTQYVDFREWQNESVFAAKFNELLNILQLKIGSNVGNIPDPEIRYLNNLIRDFSDPDRFLQHYIALSGFSDEPLHNALRPDPRKRNLAPGLSVLISSPVEDISKPKVSGVRRVKPMDDIRDAVRLHPQLVLLGYPGAGKTTTLRKIILDAANDYLVNPRTVPLPLFLRLADWPANLSLIEFIYKSWQALGLPPTNLEHSIANGSLLLCLDGLNEIGGDSKDKVTKLRNWLQSEFSPKNIVISCRKTDYEKDVLNLGLPTALIEKMSEPQIHKFVIAYLGEEKSKVFFGHLNLEEGDRALQKLASNPYLLTALIIVYQNAPNGDLPRNNGALFRALVRALWTREEELNTPSWIPLDQVELAFAKLAFDMLERKLPTTIDYNVANSYLASDLITLGHNASLLELEGSGLRFSHQLIQEYFAAVHMDQLGIAQLFQMIDDDFLLESEGWAQTIISLCGITHHKDVLLKKLCEVDSWITALCIGSGIDLPNELREEVTNKVLDFYLEGRVLYPDVHLVMNTDAAYVLNMIGWKFESIEDQAAFYIALNNWQACINLGNEAIPVILITLNYGLGIYGFDVQEFVRILNAFDLDRIIIALESLQQANEISKTELYKLVEIIFSTYPSNEIQKLPGLAILGLSDVLVRTEVFRLYGRNLAMKTLIEMLDDWDSSVRERAAEALEIFEDKSSIPALIHALEDRSWFVGKAAAWTLWQIGTRETLIVVENWWNQQYTTMAPPRDINHLS